MAEAGAAGVATAIWGAAAAGTTAYAVTAAVAYVAISAAIGAAIGALSSAVMGGDIGQGALYGAIGGAVMGGFNLAVSPTLMSSLSSGGSAMSSSGAGAGVASSSGSGSVAGWESVSLMSNAEIDSAFAAGGADVTAGSGSAGGNVGAGLTKTDLASFGKNLAKDISWSQVGATALGGAASGAANYFSAQSTAQSNEEMLDKRLVAESEENALSREQTLEIAKLNAETSLTAAREQSAASLAAQKQQQEYETAERKAEEEREDQKKYDYSRSVQSASEKFAAKTGKISNFLAEPAWLSGGGNSPAPVAA